MAMSSDPPSPHATLRNALADLRIGKTRRETPDHVLPCSLSDDSCADTVEATGC